MLLIAAAATAGILALFGTHQLTIVEAMFGIFMGTTAFIAILLTLREISPGATSRGAVACTQGSADPE
jgi:hypothetical protein